MCNYWSQQSLNGFCYSAAQEAFKVCGFVSVALACVGTHEKSFQSIDVWRWYAAVFVSAYASAH